MLASVSCLDYEFKLELELQQLGSGLSISIKSNANIFFQYIANTFYEKVNWTGCLSKGNYQLILYSIRKEQMSYKLKIDGKEIRKYENLDFNNEQIYDFSLPLEKKFTFHYPDTTSLVNQYVGVYPIHSGDQVCDKYSLSNSESNASGFTVDEKTGRVQGRSATPISVLLQVNCLVQNTIIGTTSAPIIITGSCRNSVPFSVIINSGSAESDKLSILLKSNENVEFISRKGMLPSKQHHYSFCYGSNKYTLTLSSSSGVWPVGSTVTTIISGTETIYNSAQTITNTIDANDIEKWEYSTTDNRDWYKIETTWNRFAIGTFPERRTGTYSIYFKRNFYFSGDKSILYYILNIKHNGGVAVYVNEMLVHTFKLPKNWVYGTPSSDTNGYNGAVRLLTYNLRNGLNKIAVELHSIVRGNEIFSLTISFEKDLSQCKVVSFPSMVMYYNHAGYQNPVEGFRNMLDGNLITKYTPESSTNQIGTWFAKDTNYPVNRLDYFVTQGCIGRDWRTVALGYTNYDKGGSGTGEGSDPRLALSGNHLSQLTTVVFDIPNLETSGEVNSGPYFMYSQDFINKMSVQSLFFDITPRNSGGCSGAVHSAETRMLACKPNYCLPTVELPKFGYEGTIEEINCIHSESKIIYECNKYGKWIAKSDTSVCSK